MKLFTVDTPNPRGLVRRETVNKSKKHKNLFPTELQAISFWKTEPNIRMQQTTIR